MDSCTCFGWGCKVEYVHPLTLLMFLGKLCFTYLTKSLQAFLFFFFQNFNHQDDPFSSSY